MPDVYIEINYLSKNYTIVFPLEVPTGLPTQTDGGREVAVWMRVGAKPPTTSAE